MTEQKYGDWRAWPFGNRRAIVFKNIIIEDHS